MCKATTCNNPVCRHVTHYMLHVPRLHLKASHTPHLQAPPRYLSGEVYLGESESSLNALQRKIKTGALCEAPVFTLSPSALDSRALAEHVEDQVSRQPRAGHNGHGGHDGADCQLR